MSSTLSYEQVCAAHRWEVPERYNIAADVCDRHPRDKPAMIHEDFDGNVRRLTWGELQDTANRFANVLVAHGVQRGDRVAMLLPPTPETAAAFFGTWKVGAILLSMSVLYGDEGIRHRLTDSQPKVLVTNQANADRMERSLVEHVLILDDDAAQHGLGRVRRPSTPPPTTRRSSTTPRAPPAWPRASCTPIATSWPTRSSSTATTCRTASCSTGWASGRGRPGSRRCSGPWRYGAVQCVYQREGGFDPAKQLDFLSRHEVTNVFGTPTAIRSMMSITDAGTRYPQKIRIMCSAGEPLNPEAIKLGPRAVRDHRARLLRAHRVLSAVRQLPVHGGARGLDGQADARLGRGHPRRGRAPGRRRASAARSACAPARTRTIRSATGTGPQEDSDEVFGGDWFHTKDAASTDEDGYYWYEGRADDVIISAGYRIGPFEVESACLEHPAVAEAAAVAVPDERRGNVVKAFVVLGAGHDPSDALAEEIKAFVRDHLSAYAYPRLIEFVPDLPKTLTGKIRRIELRQREQNQRLTQSPRKHGVSWPRLPVRRGCGAAVGSRAGEGESPSNRRVHT